ncbi:spore coat protein [Clostridium botulinum]|uniref:spore coat protein n=1 Tax=Clostridium botulinum TaxID=1491 RepID=UPI001FA74C78|nr:spore coat protein [Clostridium botulinum]
MVNTINIEEYQNITDTDKKCQDDPVTIGATCVAELAPNVFVLLVEVEVEVLGETIQEVLIIRITPAQAAELIRSVGLCEIVGPNEIPTPAPGREITLICSFVFGQNVFLVFDVETRTTDELVLVKVPLCPIVG